MQNKNFWPRTCRVAVKMIVLGSMIAASVPMARSASKDLRFNPDDYTIQSLTMPDGSIVTYKAYEGIYYVTNVEDSAYQTLNIYVPEHLADVPEVPILMRNYVGGYAASKAKTPSASDASGRALQEGYVVCIPGARGNNSTLTRKGKTIVTGTAPNGLLDLKAATRYLHYNDDLIPGSSDLIFTDGTSAGGAMSALQGATGNAADYEPYLKKMGAAPAKDDIFGAICYCPITDLGHADMEYEWLYGCTNAGVRHLDEAQMQISNELSALCPDYINSLGLKKKDGTPITADNYKDVIKSYLMASAHRALEEGCDISDTIGFTFYKNKFTPMGPGPMGPKPDDGRGAPSFGPGGRMAFNDNTDFVTDLDLDKYLSYVATVTALKTPPAFDQMGVIIDTPYPENKVFGNEAGEGANFTQFSLDHRLDNPDAKLSAEMDKRVKMYNPMAYIATGEATVAPNWYIRHGAKDRDTSFLVPINLATMLENNGKNVDFFLPWNRPHSGDYNLDDLFKWIAATIK